MQKDQEPPGSAPLAPRSRKPVWETETGRLVFWSDLFWWAVGIVVVLAIVIVVAMPIFQSWVNPPAGCGYC